jgi:FtsZ-binding cell division protein ZapB
VIGMRPLDREPPVKTAIDTILSMFTKRHHELDLVDHLIDNLQQGDDELERRLKELRDHVDVYQRTMRKDGGDDG